MGGLGFTFPTTENIVKKFLSIFGFTVIDL